MLSIGAVAPPFNLPDQDGKILSSADLLRAGPLLVYFYPADFTPGCTREACSFRDLHEDLVKTRLRVVGISPQGPESHRRFAGRYSLPFTLLCDEDKSVTRAFGVEGPLGFGVRRATFLINQDGVVRDAIRADLRIGLHEEFLRQAIALQA